MKNDFCCISGALEKELKQKQLEIHIRIQQRKGKKCWTYLEGIDKIIDQETELEKITKILKTQFHCSVLLQKPENVFQLQGDHRNGLRDFLLNKKLVEVDQIKLHGA
jgi:translation initiation factor 1